MRRPVQVAAKGVLGDYVPFYFCPRSVMLHSIWKGLVEGYAGGQQRVVHLVSSVEQAIALKRPWAFTNRHAEPPEAEYYTDSAKLPELRWEIINSTSWGGDQQRPFKQAEFLVHERFEWTAIMEIGVISTAEKVEVERLLLNTNHRPSVAVHHDWYYP